MPTTIVFDNYMLVRRRRSDISLKCIALPVAKYLNLSYWKFCKRYPNVETMGVIYSNAGLAWSYVAQTWYLHAQNILLVQPFSALVMNSGPGQVLHFFKYERTALLSRQHYQWHRMYTLTPCLNGSLLVTLREAEVDEGLLCCQLRSISLSDRWWAGSYRLAAGIVNSLTLMKQGNI